MAEGRCLICDKLVNSSTLYPVDPENPNGPKRGPLVQRFLGFSDPVFYCVQHLDRVRERRARPRPEFTLAPDERAAIFAGERLRIERQPGQPQLKVGDVIELSPLVSIMITRRATNKRNCIQYRYTLRDQRRDRVRLLRRKPPALRPEVARHDQVQGPTPTDIKRAAEESAYTSSSRGAIADAGEAVPAGWENVLRMEAKERRRVADEEERSEELARRQARAITESTRQVLILGARMGVDVSSHIAKIQRAIEDANQEIAKAA